MKSHFIIFILLSSVACIASDDLFTEADLKADKLYQEGQYEEALLIWKQFFEDGISDPDLYINIANAESMLGNRQQAILFYERALRLRPGNDKLIHAIARERDKIENGVVPVRSFFLIQWLNVILTLLRPSVWAFIGLLFLLTGILFWLLKLKGKIPFPFIHRFHPKIYLFLGGLLIVISVLSYRSIYRRNEAIVFSGCDFREAPAAESPLTRQLHPGEKVRIEDELGDWYKVSLLNFDKGWISKNCVQRIQI